MGVLLFGFSQGSGFLETAKAHGSSNSAWFRADEGALLQGFVECREAFTGWCKTSTAMKKQPGGGTGEVSQLHTQRDNSCCLKQVPLGIFPPLYSHCSGVHS